MVERTSTPNDKALFLYDGGCGVCKFTVKFVADRDPSKVVQFCPLQTPLAQERTGGQVDLSTSVLYDEHGNVFKESAAILNLFPYMGRPYTVLGPILLAIPAVIRDFCYRAFARNRGAIWKVVKRVTGMGDTQLHEYRDRVVGLTEDVPAGWGFQVESKKDE
jgi:predicted DCC family thiol-disulfide oxidoreductase YuxK